MNARPTDGLLDDARAVQEDLVRLRRTLHARPEVGLRLPHTQEAVLGELDGLGLETTTGRRLSSVTAVRRGAGPGPTVLLRGDMDALPVAERTGLGFASANGAMHACGHDLHTAVLETTVRTFSPEARERVERVLAEVCHGVAAAHGVEAEVGWNPLYPVTVNDPDEVATVARTVAELFGDGGYETPASPLTGSEDFSRVVDEVPGAMVFLGATPPGADPGTAPDNHSPLADFDESVLGAGAALYAALAADRLRPGAPAPSGGAAPGRGRS